jgi:signal transduction histidine kinase
MDAKGDRPAPDPARAAERRTELPAQDLLGIVAHEIKNALGPLSMALQLCERRVADGQPVAGADLAFARGQVRRISRLVNDLLDAARVDSAQLALRPAPVDLAALVRSTVEAFQRGSPCRVTCDLPAEPLVRLADGERLTDALTNLLDNAAKYAPSPLPVEVRLSQVAGADADGAGARVRLAVTDHGPGLSTADQARLFQRYFRTDVARDAAPGLGLGLYLCRVIAELHGGAIGVDSAPGQGATFWLELELGQS